MYRLKTWVQRRQLDRNTGIFTDVFGYTLRRQVFNSVGIAAEITQRIRICSRGFAQHVVGVAVALLFITLSSPKSFLNSSPQNKLPAHLCHSLGSNSSHHRITEAFGQAAQDFRQVHILEWIDQFARHHQSPGRDINQRRLGLAEVCRPVTWAEFVVNQRLDGRAVRYAKQCLGQTHQGNTFIGCQAIFREKLFDQRWAGFVTYHPDQVCCPGRN